MASFLMLLFLFSSPVFAKTKIAYQSINTISDIQKYQSFNTPVIIFSSRDYLSFLAVMKGVSDIYWIIPSDEVTKNDLNLFDNYLKEKKQTYELKQTSEGAGGKIENTDFVIVAKKNMPMVTVEKSIIIVDVDFFFRTFKSDSETPKMYELVRFFRTIDELNWNPAKIILVKSRDINLPDWTREIEYAFKRAYEAWRKNEFPDDLLLLDTVDQNLFYFFQYDEAYTILKSIEPQQKTNPFFYKRFFVAAMKTYNDSDVLKAVQKAYALDRDMIGLYMEGAEYLIDKQEFYPAYILVKDGMKQEPWNQTLQKKMQNILEAGYNYYSNDESRKDLFEIFEKELKKQKAQ